MPTIPVRGVDLYYEEYGEGPAILGIHGTPSSVVLWRDAGRTLGGHGRCVIYERRGFPRSGPAPATLDLADHVEDAAALIDALAATPAAVIGRSTGGQIALALAHHVPKAVQALILLEPAAVALSPEAAAWAARVRHAVLRAAATDPSAAAEALIREGLGGSTWSSFPQELRQMFAAASPAVLAELNGRGLDLSAEPRDLTDEDLARIHQPTLVVSAEESPTELRRVNDRLHQALPNVEKALVSGGHFIDPAHPAVLEFVDRAFATRHS